MVDERAWTAMMVAIWRGSLDCLREIEQHFDYAMYESGRRDLDVWVTLAKHFSHQHVVTYLLEKKEQNMTAEILSNMRLTHIAELTDHTQEVKHVQEKNKRERKEKICWNCPISSSSTQLLRCAGCRKARYCGEECQGKDRERHLEWCKKKEMKRT